jgi:aldehyde dehydrogenase (NAD+)
MLDKRQFYINGNWVRSEGTHTLSVISPSTEEPIATISLGVQRDLDKAVSAARSALPSWSSTSKETRIKHIERILALYQTRAEDLAKATSLEMGSPITAARDAQVRLGLNNIKSFLSVLKTFEFERELNSRAPNDRILLDPIGVVGLITPWNWPMNQITLKVIPALAAGCTAILKPSELAPLSAGIFAEILHDAELPGGVFNLVNGDGSGIGNAMSGHPGIDMISFTGSARAGIAIQRSAADTIKRVCLELGGKGANLVFVDADDGAIPRGVKHAMMASGQSCNVPTRMLIQRDIYDKSVELAAATGRGIKVGHPEEEGDHLGPLVSRAQYDRVQSYIKRGIEEGARLVLGGLGRPDGFDRGNFVRPTIFADAHNQMTIAREEIFGPVLTIIPFETEEEAIQIANDTPYGLTNIVQSQNLDRVRRMARALRCGMVELNAQRRGFGSPFGGVKMSGNGREGGEYGLMEYLEIKAVSGWNYTEIDQTAGSTVTPPSHDFGD